MKRDEFKVGDIVYSFTEGKGEVIEINNIGETKYPVIVCFEKRPNEKWSYTYDGITNTKSIRTLFFEEIKIHESAYKRPKWRAKPGDIYCHISGTGLIMHSAEFDNFDNNAYYRVGNYFKTEEEAKESKFYKVFHEEE